MDAPTYPPSVSFALPARIVGKLSASDTAISDLSKDPAAWSIVLKEIPFAPMLMGAEQLKPHLGNFSLRSLIQFGVVKPDALDRIDAQFRALDAAR